MALLPVFIGLWLDLRGTPSTSGLTALLDLYTGVRKQFDKAGLPPPVGSGVGGVLHLAKDLVADDDDPMDGGLQLFVLDGDDLYSDGRRVGTAISLSSSSSMKTQRARALESIRRPEANLALLGSRKAEIGALFEFCHAQAQHCRSISGSDTRILCEVPSSDLLSTVTQAVASDDVGVEVVAVLHNDPAIWFDAFTSNSRS